MKEPIILIGGGGHCKSCIDVIETGSRFEVAGIVDMKKNIGQKVLGYEIIASDEDLDKLTKKFHYFLITLGQIKSPERRIEIFNLLDKLNVTMPVVISPLAHVSKHAKIGRGTIIMHHAIVNVSAIIGNNCIINNKALIEHDCVIGNHCHISTGCIVNGGVKTGTGTFIGSGAVCREYVTIPDFGFVKANSIYKG